MATNDKYIEEIANQQLLSDAEEPNYARTKWVPTSIFGSTKT